MRLICSRKTGLENHKSGIKRTRKMVQSWLNRRKPRDIRPDSWQVPRESLWRRRRRAPSAWCSPTAPASCSASVEHLMSSAQSLQPEPATAVHARPHYIYRPRSRGDNMFGSVRVSVHLSVGTLLFESFDLWPWLIFGMKVDLDLG